MTTPDPVAIVKDALAKGELDKLLLGSPEYRYLTKFSPAPGNTDLAELLTVVYERLEPESREKAKDQLLKALYSIVETYEGLEPVARCILYETFEKSKGRFTLGLPLSDIANKLKTNMQTFESRLRLDKSGAGWQWPNGLLGELQKLSLNTEKYGGPSFCK